MTEEQWADLKVRRLKAIHSSIKTLKANTEPKLRRHRFGRLHGQISELRIVGLFTAEESTALILATEEARKIAFEATPDADQADDPAGTVTDNE